MKKTGDLVVLVVGSLDLQCSLGSSRDRQCARRPAGGGLARATATQCDFDAADAEDCTGWSEFSLDGAAVGICLPGGISVPAG